LNAFNARDDPAEAAARTADYVAHAPESIEPAVLDSDAWLGFLGVFLEGVPGSPFEVLGLLGRRGDVALRLLFTGTHTGNFRGLRDRPQSGSPACEINRMAGGRVAEHWFQLDSVTLFEQLGLRVVPGPRLLHALASSVSKQLAKRRRTVLIVHVPTTGGAATRRRRLQRWVPRSENSMPEPTTRSFTVRETTTSPGAACTITGRDVHGDAPMSSPQLAFAGRRPARIWIPRGSDVRMSSSAHWIARAGPSKVLEAVSVDFTSRPRTDRARRRTSRWWASSTSRNAVTRGPTFARGVDDVVKSTVAKRAIGLAFSARAGEELLCTSPPIIYPSYRGSWSSPSSSTIRALGMVLREPAPMADVDETVEAAMQNERGSVDRSGRCRAVDGHETSRQQPDHSRVAVARAIRR